jgi:Plasmid pRiA4b ORF-3-like protein
MPIAYQLRIELRHFKPAIYRDVLVDPATTLPKLHKLIQAAMGWDDVHLHGFALPLKGESYWRVPSMRRFEKPNLDGWGEPAQNESRFKLQDLLHAPKDKLLYLYDFGDDWEHVITLKAVVEADVPLPHLQKAQNACPPEDCGGPPGAEYWASVWHDKAHAEHDVALEMFGEHAPGWLDFEALQKAVKKLQPKLRLVSRSAK